MSVLTIDYVNESTVDVLKKRFKQHQQQLKKKAWRLNDFRDHVSKVEPQFNCPDGWEAIRKAWYGITPNVRLTELMEELTNSIENGSTL